MTTTKQSPKCAQCSRAMERGFILDNDHSHTKPAAWVEGEPVPSFWFGVKTRGARQRKIVAYRCPACGLLQQFAH
jgi:DNA-directed RNA polymerase subunit RPC12/RpoP